MAKNHQFSIISKIDGKERRFHQQLSSTKDPYDKYINLEDGKRLVLGRNDSTTPATHYGNHQFYNYKKAIPYAPAIEQKATMLIPGIGIGKNNQILRDQSKDQFYGVFEEEPIIPRNDMPLNNQFMKYDKFQSQPYSSAYKEALKDLAEKELIIPDMEFTIDPNNQMRVIDMETRRPDKTVIDKIKQKPTLNLQNNFQNPLFSGGKFGLGLNQKIAQAVKQPLSSGYYSDDNYLINNPIRGIRYATIDLSNDIQQAAQQQNLLNAQQQEEYNQYRNKERSAFDDNPILSPRTWLQQQNQQQELQQKQEEDIHGNPFPNQRQQHFATGGSVSSNYDPYLNTYNYPYNTSEPYSLASDGDNQAFDSRYEDGGYDYPDMSYGNAYDDDGAQYSFKEGGSVKEEDLPRLADLIRRHGRNGDTVLAHINPIEAQILKSLGGSGTINPKTGIPEFGGVWDFITTPFREIGKGIGKLTGTEGGMFGSKGTYWSKPTGFKADVSNALSYGPAVAVGMNLLPKKTKKAATSFGQKYVIPVGAAMMGNTFLPGIGGAIGGSLGGAAGAGLRGSSLSEGAMRGGTIGALLPSAASMGGSIANSLGFNSLGSTLSNYGTQNSILSALGLGGSSGSSGLFGLGGSNPYVSGGLSSAAALSSGMGTGRGQGLGVSSGDYAENYYDYMLDRQKKQDNMGFTDKLKDYLTEPKNLLTLGTTAAQYLGREKPKSPEKIAEEERRYRNASRKTIAEVEADEALETARADLQKKRKNKQLEEDIKNMGSVQRRAVSPEEFARTGRWLEYTDEDGRPLRMKGGGSAHSPYAYLMEETYYPASPIGYLSGDSGGQDDLIDAKLSDGEYVFDASTVSDLGDGNNAAGARKLDMFRENIRKHKRGGKVNLPPRSKSLESYLRG